MSWVVTVAGTFVCHCLLTLGHVPCYRCSSRRRREFVLHNRNIISYSTFMPPGGCRQIERTTCPPLLDPEESNHISVAYGCPSPKSRDMTIPDEISEGRPKQDPHQPISTASHSISPTRPRRGSLHGRKEDKIEVRDPLLAQVPAHLEVVDDMRSVTGLLYRC